MTIGNSSPASSTRMPMATSISVSVKPPRRALSRDGAEVANVIAGSIGSICARADEDEGILLPRGISQRRMQEVRVRVHGDGTVAAGVEAGRIHRTYNL